MTTFEGKTYYEILQVEPNAPVDEIRAAFRKQSRKYHPDMPSAPENAEELSRELGRVSAILMSPASRIEYNREIGLDADGAPLPASTSLPTPDFDDETGVDDFFNDDAVEETPVIESPVERKSQGNMPAYQGENPHPRSVNRPQTNVEDYDPAAINPMELVNTSKLSWRDKKLDQKERVIMTRPMRSQLTSYTLSYLAAMALVIYIIVFLSGAAGVNMVFPTLAALVATGFGLHWIFTQYRASVQYIVTAGVSLFALYYVSKMTSFDDPMNFGHAIVAAILIAGSTALVHLGAKARHISSWVKSQRGKIVFKDKHLLEGQVWGKAGQVGGVESFSDRNRELGAIGEQHTAQVLSYLMNIPGTKVFHCLRFPVEGSPADVDHVVINGNKAALIDSKMWSGGLYSWEDAEHVKKTSTGSKRYINIEKTNFPFAVNEYNHKRFFEAEVRGWMVLYSNNGYPVKVNNDGATNVRMVTPHRMVEEIGAWFTQDTETLGRINKGLANAALMSMKPEQ